MSTVNTVSMLSAVGLNCPDQPHPGCPPTSPAPVLWQGFPDGPQVHVVTLSPTVSLALSPVSSCAAPGWTWPWFMPSLVSGAADRCCYQPLALPAPLTCCVRGWTLIGEGIACAGVTLGSWLILPWGAAPLTLFPDKQDKSLMKLQEDKFRITIKKTCQL